MGGEPAYIIRRNIRQYEEMMADPLLPANERATIEGLVAEMRAALPAAEAIERR